MEKLIGFIRRRDDLAFAAFSMHWRTVHRGHALKLDRWLRGYVQAHLRPGPWPDVQRPADGCPLLWLDARADMAALAASEAFRRGAHLDEPRFMEGRSSGLPVAEEVLRPPPAAAAVKLMLFLGIATGRRAEERVWPAERASGHVRNHAVPRPGGDPAYGFDLVEELWWDDVAAYQADRAAAPGLAAIPWLDPHRCKAALVDEVVVIPPPR